MKKPNIPSNVRPTISNNLSISQSRIIRQALAIIRDRTLAALPMPKSGQEVKAPLQSHLGFLLSKAVLFTPPPFLGI